MMNEPLPYVMTAALRQRLDLLHHLLEFGRQLVLVVGPRGSGRTRLLEILGAEAAAHWRVMAYNGFELTTPQRLLAAIASGLGLTGADGEPALRRVRTGLLENSAAGRVCALVIDDADALDEGCLSLLYELALGGADSGELHVVLAGDAGADLGDRLTALAPQPALLHLVEVPPLDLAATRAMVARLEEVSGTTITADDEQVEVLWQRVQGRPGALLAACSALLVRPATATAAGPPAAPTNAGSGPPRQHAAVPHKYRWLAVLCLLGIGAGALLHFASAKHRQAANTVELALPGPTVAVPALLSADAVEFEPGASAAENATVEVEPASPRPAGTADAAPSAYATVAADPGEADDGAPQAPIRPLPTPVPLPATPPTAPVAGAPPAAAPTTGRDAPTAIGSAPADAHAAAAGRLDGPAQATSSASKLPPAGPSKPAAPPQPATAPTTPPAEQSEAKTGYSSEWVLTRPSQSYVIQLFASREQAAAKRFITAHGVTARAAVTPITHSGQRWYVVVYGHYATRSAATAAIARLPAALAGLKPWPRLVQSLKQVRPAH